MNSQISINLLDPWDPLHTLQKYGQHRLTSVEFTITQRCNMRCEHCAVGESLVQQEGPRIPLNIILKRLDEVKTLQTISITGGEPSFDEKTIVLYLIPLLKYAKARGLQTQINTNLTLAYERYERLAPYVDVFHISFNYLNAEDFHHIGFAKQEHPVPFQTAEKLYHQMTDNIVRLARGGAFVSAESMINYRTYDRLPQIHREIVRMGCRRHEIHPMYSSSFAANLAVLSLTQLREAIHHLLDQRNPNLWMLFGTLPFFACSPDRADRELIERLQHTPHVTIRNDPDGRNRLNVNTFTGDVYVTDFSDVPAIGNIKEHALEQLFTAWSERELQRRINCYCPTAKCCGPNLLVADMYYKDVNFTSRKAWSE
jgi:radical SAM/CxCxxxxC motif protein YfkAB